MALHRGQRRAIWVRSPRDGMRPYILRRANDGLDGFARAFKSLTSAVCKACAPFFSQMHEFFCDDCYVRVITQPQKYASE